jgi:DNA invertase Pin-like site-specific DNA recombinase
VRLRVSRRGGESSGTGKSPMIKVFRGIVTRVTRIAIYQKYREKMDSKKMKAIGYVRVSSARQEDNCRWTHQESVIKAYAENRGWDIEIIKEVRSAKTIEKRQVLRGALQKLKSGEANILMVLAVDRLTRNVDDGSTLLKLSEQQGWVIWPLDLPPEHLPREYWVKNFRQKILDAHYELDVLSVRVKQGLASSPNKDQLGSRRFPTYSDQVLHRIKYLKKVRKFTYEQIAEKINQEGYPITRPAHSDTVSWNAAKVKAAYRKAVS